MIKTIDGNFLILFIVFAGASASRIFLDGHQHLDNVIAFINTVSILFVCYLIRDKSGEFLIKLLDSCDLLGDKTKKKKRRFFKKLSNIICILLLVIGIVYSLFLANSISNDIIGFVALFLSIETEYISSCIGEIFFKKK